MRTQEPRGEKGQKGISTNANPATIVKRYDYRSTQIYNIAEPQTHNSVSLNIQRDSLRRKKMALRFNLLKKKCTDAYT